MATVKGLIAILRDYGSDVEVLVEDRTGLPPMVEGVYRQIWLSKTEWIESRNAVSLRIDGDRDGS